LKHGDAGVRLRRDRGKDKDSSAAAEGSMLHSVLTPIWSGVIPFLRYVVTIFSTEAASVRFRKEVPGWRRERGEGERAG
jgi:hypothetical protein